MYQEPSDKHNENCMLGSMDLFVLYPDKMTLVQSTIFPVSEEML